MHSCTLRHKHRAKSKSHVMNNNDCFNATEKRGDEEGEEEEISSKCTVLDAYNQRELNSCNRSKKHPWVVKSRNVGGESKGK